MPVVRTTMRPLEPINVTEAQYDDLAAQKVLLEGTRATTDEGLTEAALRQVREASMDPATRAAVEASEERAKQQRARATRPRRARRSSSAPDAATTTSPGSPDGGTAPAGDGFPDGPPTTDVLPGAGDTVADATTTETSGDDTPAGTTDANQES